MPYMYGKRGILPPTNPSISHHNQRRNGNINRNDIKIMTGHIESSPRLIVKKDGTVLNGKFVINTSMPGLYHHTSTVIDTNQYNNPNLNLNLNAYCNDKSIRIGYNKKIIHTLPIISIPNQ